MGAEGVEAAARVFTMCHINRSTDGVAPLYICAERSRWVFAETPHSVLNVFTSQMQTTSVCRMSPFGCEITKIPKTQSRCVQRAVRTIVGRLNSTQTCRRRAESCCWSLRLHTHHASISDVTVPTRCDITVIRLPANLPSVFIRETPKLITENSSGQTVAAARS